MAADLTGFIVQPPWLTHIATQLEERNERETKPFLSLYSAYVQSLEEARVFKRQYFDLKNMLVPTPSLSPPSNEDKAENNGDTAATPNTANDNSSSLNIAEVLKQKEEHASHAALLKVLVKKLTIKCDELEVERKQLREAVEALKLKVSAQVEVLREKDVSIQVLQDELTTTQLELSTAEKKYAEVKNENVTLVERWIKKMNEEVEKMNMFNEAATPHPKSVKKKPEITSSPKVGLGDSEEWEIETYENAFAKPMKIPGSPKKTFAANNDTINVIRCSPLGDMFATGSNEKKVRIFNSQSGDPILILEDFTHSIYSLEFNSTQEMLVGGQYNGGINVWKLKNSQNSLILNGHTGKVSSLCLSEDSKDVISTSQDRTIKLWDLAKGYCKKSVNLPSMANDSCLMLGNGSSVATGHADGHLRIWDLNSGRCSIDFADIHTDQITSINNTTGGYDILTNSKDGTLKLVDLRNHSVKQQFTEKGYFPSSNWSRACLSPDCDYIAAGSVSGAIHIWELATGSLLKTLKESKGAIQGVQWTYGDKACFFSAELSKNVTIWE